MFSKKLFLAVSSLAALTPAPPVVAFSCINWPVITNTVNDARNSPKELLVGYGTFSGDISMVDHPRNGEETLHQFSGILFDGDQPLSVEQTQVAARFDCESGTWCGFPQKFRGGTHYLIVFDIDGATGQLYIKHSGPCDFTVGHEVNISNLQDLARCLSEGDCTEIDLGL